jgi:hypothetical protein
VVALEAALPTGVLRLGTATVVGVRSRWTTEGAPLDSGFALDFNKSGAAAARVRRRLAAGEAARPALEAPEAQRESVPV